MGMLYGACFMTVLVLLVQGPGCPLDSTPAEHSDGGIVGRVWVGPTCPGPVREDAPNCGDKPYSATVLVLAETGDREVTRFTSDAEGRFRVPLPPGRYRLVPQSEGRFPRAAPATVEVRSGEWTYVEIHYDSGLR